MASYEYELAEPPSEDRARELWIQHAAGFILFEDVRRYAVDEIDPNLSGKVRAAVEKGIDDALYGLMMVIDGVSGGISNADHAVRIDFLVRLTKRGDSQNGGTLYELDLRNGDGMCMGIHGWHKGDFGQDAIVVPRVAKTKPKRASRRRS